MTTEVKAQPGFGTKANGVKGTIFHFKERRTWIPCPRCIGGNMYRDSNNELVCIQCGCSYRPDQHQSAKV
jgi:uncharacterized protein (DUF983 family)